MCIDETGQQKLWLRHLECVEIFLAGMIPRVVVRFIPNLDDLQYELHKTIITDKQNIGYCNLLSHFRQLQIHRVYFRTFRTINCEKSCRKILFAPYCLRDSRVDEWIGQSKLIEIMWRKNQNNPLRRGVYEEVRNWIEFIHESQHWRWAYNVSSLFNQCFAHLLISYALV